MVLRHHRGGGSTNSRRRGAVIRAAQKHKNPETALSYVGDGHLFPRALNSELERQAARLAGSGQAGATARPHNASVTLCRREGYTLMYGRRRRRDETQLGGPRGA